MKPDELHVVLDQTPLLLAQQRHSADLPLHSQEHITRPNVLPMSAISFITPVVLRKKLDTVVYNRARADVGNAIALVLGGKAAGSSFDQGYLAERNALKTGLKCGL
jgi:hypothetical protein